MFLKHYYFNDNCFYLTSSGLRTNYFDNRQIICSLQYPYQKESIFSKFK